MNLSDEGYDAEYGDGLIRVPAKPETGLLHFAAVPFSETVFNQ